MLIRFPFIMFYKKFKYQEYVLTEDGKFTTEIRMHIELTKDAFPNQKQSGNKQANFFRNKQKNGELSYINPHIWQ